MNFRRIAVVVAHPDDAEIGCLGTLACLQASISILILTDGSDGVDLSKPHPVDLGETRRVETTAALRILPKCEVHFADLKDGEISADQRTIHIIERFLRRENPELLITHPTGNIADHQDHQACAKAALNCGYRIPSIRAIWGFEPIRYRPQDWTPTLFVEVTPYLKMKVDALAAHKSQHGRFYLTEEWVRHRARQNALLARSGAYENGESYEAFSLERLVYQ